MTTLPRTGMFSVRELSAFTGRSSKVIRGMIERGEMAATRLGRMHVVPRAEAFRALKLQDPEGPSPMPLPELPSPPPLPTLSEGAAARLAQMERRRRRS